MVQRGDMGLSSLQKITQATDMVGARENKNTRGGGEQGRGLSNTRWLAAAVCQIHRVA